MNSTTPHRLLTLLLTVLVGLTASGACDKSSDQPGEASDDQPPTDDRSESGESAADETPNAPTPPSESAESSDDSTWSRVAEDELSEAGTEKLERARAARKKLGKSLQDELQRAVSDRSFVGAVKFCNARAPEIAQSVADEENLEIGRTSHKLRNPDNVPPDWAADAVERKEARQYVFRGPDDDLGYLHPIELKGLCVNCHGAEDRLAPGVSDMLGKHYPKDEATGFEVGDLRGWFWVEVRD